MAVQQSLINRLGKERGKNEIKSYYNTGYSYLVTQPSTNRAQQGFTLLSRQNMLLSFWYGNSALNSFLKFQIWEKVSKRENSLWYCTAGKVENKNIRGIWKWELLLALVIGQAALPYNCLSLWDEKKMYQKEKKISDTAWLGKKRTKK